jgi:hypothetical protein
VSHDRKWLAVIYSAGGDAHVEVFAIDAYGDLTPVATSISVGATAFNGVAISQQGSDCRHSARRARAAGPDCRMYLSGGERCHRSRANSGQTLSASSTLAVSVCMSNRVSLSPCTVQT